MCEQTLETCIIANVLQYISEQQISHGASECGEWYRKHFKKYRSNTNVSKITLSSHP